MQFVPAGELADRPNVIADGAALPSTVLTLSHWPHSPTPAGLAEDTSARIAFDYLDHASRWPAAEAVSNDHFDQDGLVSVFALVSPDEARARRAVLEDVAAAGDFATFADRDAARVSFALAAMADPERSPLGSGLLQATYPEQCAGLYEELLGRLPELVDHVERHRWLWQEEDAALAAAEAALAAGDIAIEEVPQLDLAVVSIPAGRPSRLATRFSARRDAACHPAAINNATSALRILIIQGHRYELVYRYESWVKYTSRRPLPRVDLAPLALLLQGEERNGARWSFDGVAALVPSLRLADGHESDVAPARLRETVERFLAAAPPAWDPYASAPG
ncbi:MAG TPA: DUF6687 family protein [Acidimicrobiales bacterium]|nr:DUF6687 family protein [Acidimicrobiales bacterium]